MSAECCSQSSVCPLMRAVTKKRTVTGMTTLASTMVKKLKPATKAVLVLLLQVMTMLP